MNFIKKLVPQYFKNLYHLGQSIIANLKYGFPSRDIKVIGVTGTNGKTTTVQMITKIFEEAGKKVAMASTINFRLDDKKWTNATKYTTLSPFAVQRFIREAVDLKCEYLVLETSSHSLDQFRVWGIKYDVAVITNVTREHLDYHRTMERYRKAKEKLFKMASKNNGALVANLEMEDVQYFIQYKALEKYGYATKKQKRKFPPELKAIIAEDVRSEVKYSEFRIGNSKFVINLPGLFNVENALAATCVGLSQGISLEQCAQAISKIDGIPGRMEHVLNGRDIEIIIDYAVTPDSLQKLYEYITRIIRDRDKSGRVISVLGSCGERDRGKRPIMGDLVAQYADFICVTNEDPYHEDPQRIIDEVFSGVVKHKKEGDCCWRIPDRREAIRKALSIAKHGDIVVITGKGAEETMAIGNQRIPWNERQVIEEELAKL